MATALLRSGAGVLRRSVALGSARAASGGGPPIDHQKGKIGINKTGVGQSHYARYPGTCCGLERYELLAKLAGNEDPFEMNVKKRAKGSFDEPTMIPSLYDKRLVGCICEEDAVSINWMYLHKGEPKRCECGYWFKLADLQPQSF
ncbi:hypothetical protein BaRGS_00019673 [Batillaria attramentaria]|uniref:Cytochrome c oxidase subunit 5B, mitochondrial n=1 Tax=Batillaria attramentaria TaxID=370345 RepID=A0ABD0KQ61_9CAEN